MVKLSNISQKTKVKTKEMSEKVNPAFPQIHLLTPHNVLLLSDSGERYVVLNLNKITLNKHMWS